VCRRANNDGANPLVNGGGKLIPSVARVFRGDRDLEVFLQAYMGNALAGQGSSQLAEKVAANSSVIGFVSLYCHSPDSPASWLCA
jgi:hypothetical protein